MKTIVPSILAICVAHFAAAGELEKQTMGYWAPDKEAMLKAFTASDKVPKEEAAKMVADISMVFHVEDGKANVYSDQGRMTVPYEVVSSDEETKTLEVRAKGQAGAPPAQAMKLKIGDGQITVTGSPLPFILKKVDLKDFTKLIEGLPSNQVGP